MGKKIEDKNKSEVCINAIIQLHIYPIDVMLSVGQTHKELCDSIEGKLNRKLSLSDINMLILDESKEAACAVLEGNKIVLILKKLPNTPSDFGALSHEIFHATACTLDYLGAKLEVGVSDEPYAYLLGFITEKVYEIINPFY